MGVPTDIAQYGVIISYASGFRIKDYFEKGDHFDDIEEFFDYCRECCSEYNYVSVEVLPDDDEIEYQMRFVDSGGHSWDSFYFKLTLKYNMAIAGEIEELVL